MGSNGTDPVFIANILNNDGNAIEIYKDSNKIGSIGIQGTNDLTLHSTATNHKGLRLGEGYYIPVNNQGSPEDNAVDIGMTSYRYKDVHAVNYYGDGSNLTGVGGSTTFGDVGTYVLAYSTATPYGQSPNIGAGTTVSGTTIKAGALGWVGNQSSALIAGDQGSGATMVTGTWRFMSSMANNYNRWPGGLWVRIS
jgi:hypothetical protein